MIEVKGRGSFSFKMELKVLKIPAMHHLLVGLILLYVSTSLTQGIPTSKSNQGRYVIQKKDLCHSWASTDLSGDAIWLVLDKIYITLNEDNTFKALAKMHEGNIKHFNGTFSIGIGKINFKTGTQKIACYYSINDGQLTIKPNGHSVTVKLTQGPMPDVSSEEQAPKLPGIHF